MKSKGRIDKEHVKRIVNGDMHAQELSGKVRNVEKKERKMK